MNLLPFRAALPDPVKLSEDAALLDECRENYLALQRDGGYVKAALPAYYILRFCHPSKPTRFAIGGLIDVATYNQADGRGIRPHEQTLTERMADHRARMLAYQAIIKPVLLTTNGGNELMKAMAAACEFTQPLVTYQRWNNEVSLFAIEDEGQIEQFGQLVTTDCQLLAVADGHHRVATMQLLARELGGQYGKFPVMIMPESCLGIDTFIRSVAPQTGAMAKLEVLFTVQAVQTLTPPTHAGEWLLAFQGEFYQLTRKQKDGTLDAVWFNDVVLPELFSITDSRNDPRLKSVEAFNGLETFRELISAKPQHYHFFGQPLTMDDFFECIERKELLPPKSTYFYPRVPTGLVVYEF